MNVPMEQWDGLKLSFPMMKTLQATSDIGVLVVEWLLPSILTWYREKIMREEIEKVLEAMREDYKRWSNWSSNYKPNPHSDTKIMNEMIENYCNGLEVTEGSRYWKIISTSGSGTQRSVNGFIVKAGDKKFREGDMLKAAGWAAPARNFARGNVLDGSGVNEVRWTGIG
jgi:hypothetical protein